MSKKEEYSLAKEIKYDFESYFERGTPSSVYSKADLPRFNDAFMATINEIDRLAKDVLHGANDDNTRIYREHELGSTGCFYRDVIVPRLIRGESIDQIARGVHQHYLERSPLKRNLIMQTLPVFCEAMGLQTPAIAKQAPPSYVLIIDDSLEMDLKARRITCVPRDIFKNTEPPIITIHAKTAKQGENVVRNLAYEMISPSVVICDYKLNRPEEPEQRGDLVLADLLGKMPKPPAKAFLISKSGFEEKDKGTLESRGIVYAHANELHAIAAYQAGDSANLEFSTQIAKTSTLRSWFNDNFTTSYPTGKYTTPHIDEKEKGRVGVTDVVKRIRENQVTQLGAHNLLDFGSIPAAFRSGIDDSRLNESQKLLLSSGIQGESFQGRIALSVSGVQAIRESGDRQPILLMLDHDYDQSDNAVIGKVDGVVLLKKGAQHIAITAKNKGIPVAFAHDTGDAIFVRDNALYVKNGQSPSLFAKEGDLVSFDGERLLLCKGHAPLIQANPAITKAVRSFAEMSANHIGLTWHVKGEPDHTGVRVMLNIDSADDLEKAIGTGMHFHGVGLVRTERGLLDGDGVQYLQQAVLGGEDVHTQGLTSLLRHSKHQFWEMFSQVRSRGKEDFAFTVRLLDAPPQEYFPNPQNSSAIEQTAKQLDVPIPDLSTRCAALYQKNIRGAAFGCAYPEVYKAQCDGLFQSARSLGVKPRIMVPNVRSADEVEAIKKIVDDSAKAAEMEGKYTFGVMLETKDAVIASDADQEGRKRLGEIIKSCDFVSFGTNDLTEELLGIPRGDLGKLAKWQHEEQKPFDPFVVLDEKVRDTLARTVKFIHEQKPLMPIGICGQQALSHDDAGFFQRARITSISVPPTEEAICSGLIQSGGAALVSYTDERERLASQMGISKSESSKTDIIKPTEVIIPYQKILDRSQVAFVYVEDDPIETQALTSMLNGYPVAIASNITAAVDAVASLKSQGKKVVLITDMQIGFGDQEKYGKARYGWAAGDIQRDKKWGVELANAAQNRKTDDATPDAVAVMTAGSPSYYGLADGITTFNKTDNLEGQLVEFMDRHISGDRHTTRATNRPSTGDLPPH